jgi:hypothetical protein
VIADEEVPESMTALEARERLAARGIPFSENHFLRHIRSGNRAIVRLYIRAGMSPNTRLDGETALAASANAGHIDLTRLLLEAGADPMGLTEGLKIKKDGKDLWERLASLSGVFTFIASLAVAAIGWWFTSAYNGRQLELTKTQSARDDQNRQYQNRLIEMQTVEKMIPHLTKDEPSKRAALIAISVLGSPEMAAQIAQVFGGQGSIDALRQIASTEKNRADAPAVAALTNLAKVEQGSDARPAQYALARVLEGKGRAIVKLLAAAGPRCNGFIVDGSRGRIATPSYCVQDLKTTPLTIQFNDGSRTPVQDAVFSRDGLIAMLNTGKLGLPSIQLSQARLSSGSTVTQLAVDLVRDEFGIIFGQVIEAGEMSFQFPGSSATEASANGLKVKLAMDGRARAGTAGGPLLDNEGNAACMTYLSAVASQVEQCLAADVIAKAMQEVTR